MYICTIQNRYNMKTITTTNLRDKLKYHLDLVSRSFETIIIPRNNNDEPVVLMPLSEYNSLKETDYLLSPEKNRKRLLESINQAEQGKTMEFKE